MSPPSVAVWYLAVLGWVSAGVLLVLWRQARQGWADALRGWLAARGDTDHAGNDRRGILALSLRLSQWRGP